jgi:hypothetical protein
VTDRNAQLHTDTEAREPARKPYQKPDFQYERVFETMALVCGKAHVKERACRVNRKNS